MQCWLLTADYWPMINDQWSMMLTKNMNIDDYQSLLLCCTHSWSLNQPPLHRCAWCSQLSWECGTERSGGINISSSSSSSTTSVAPFDLHITSRIPRHASIVIRSCWAVMYILVRQCSVYLSTLCWSALISILLVCQQLKVRITPKLHGSCSCWTLHFCQSRIGIVWGGRWCKGVGSWWLKKFLSGV